jgi:hypothetical protein
MDLRVNGLYLSEAILQEFGLGGNDQDQPQVKALNQFLLTAREPWDKNLYQWRLDRLKDQISLAGEPGAGNGAPVDSKGNYIQVLPNNEWLKKNASLIKEIPNDCLPPELRKPNMMDKVKGAFGMNEGAVGEFSDSRQQAEQFLRFSSGLYDPSKLPKDMVITPTLKLAPTATPFKHGVDMNDWIMSNLKAANEKLPKELQVTDDKLSQIGGLSTYVPHADASNLSNLQAQLASAKSKGYGPEVTDILQAQIDSISPQDSDTTPPQPLPQGTTPDSQPGMADKIKGAFGMNEGAFGDGLDRIKSLTSRVLRG